MKDTIPNESAMKYKSLSPEFPSPISKISCVKKPKTTTSKFKIGAMRVKRKTIL